MPDQAKAAQCIQHTLSLIWPPLHAVALIEVLFACVHIEYFILMYNIRHHIIHSCCQMYGWWKGGQIFACNAEHFTILACSITYMPVHRVHMCFSRDTVPSLQLFLFFWKTLSTNRTCHKLLTFFCVMAKWVLRRLLSSRMHAYFL